MSPDHDIFSTHDLALSFGSKEILKGVDVAIRGREFVSLLGPSGSGKSTILNIAAGLLKPSGGTATFDGKPITKVNTRVGYMTQDDTLLPWRTVEANVALPLRLQRSTKKKEIHERVDRMLHILELEHAKDLYPSQLSGGMKRRALLARSMIYEPDLLLMDEPFAALDAQLRTQMHIELLRAVTHLEQAVLFVTHDIHEAALMSDRVVVIGGGPPASVIDEHLMPWGRDRDLESLRFASDFAAIERTIHSSLQVARTQAEPTQPERVPA